MSDVHMSPPMTRDDDGHFRPNPVSTYDVPLRVAVHEVQIQRIMSDLESEKATRMRVNTEILKELRELREAQQKSDKIIYSMLACLGLIQFLATLFIALLKMKG